MEIGESNELQESTQTPASSDEVQEIQQPQPPETEVIVEEKKNNLQLRKRIKQGLLGIGAILVIWIIYSIVHLYVSPDKHIQQIYLVPKDAAFIIQTADPVKDWHKFSSSEVWKSLKRSKSLGEIAENVEAFDSIIQDNKTLLSLVGKRDMIISIHKTRSDDWDMLILLDLQKASKMNILKDQIENIAKLAGQIATQRTYKEINILELRDPDTREILYTAFVDNHFVVSYTSKLVEAAIDERENPVIGLNPAFLDVEKIVGGKGLFQMYINYAYLPQFMRIYLGEDNEFLTLFSNSMEFAGLYLNVDKEKLELKGHTQKKEETDPYVNALFNSGKHKMKAHEILSGRTAFYTNIGMESPVKFVEELEKLMAADDPEMYKSYLGSRKKLESYFGISLTEHFLSWMDGEFAMTQSEPGLLGSEPELILAIRAKSIKDAKKKMEYVEKKVKNRSPIKVKTVTYKKHEVNYIEMKGFFRLFFGKLFDKFEKPYYTYIDDYVVFSNHASSLLSFIEDYEQKNVLKKSPAFQTAYAHFSSSSTFFMYTDMHKFYPQLQGMLTPATWKDIQGEKDILYTFPGWSMQITGEKRSVSLQYVMDYKPYEEEEIFAVNADPDEEDKVMNEEATTEKQLMNELKQFYVEKFQGNVLREFYAEGALKSESEVKDGKRHGRYREYYESGKMKVRGKYVNNRQKGTWKYYTEEGKFDKKEKF